MLKAEGRRLKARKAKSELSAAVLAALFFCAACDGGDVVPSGAPRIVLNTTASIPTIDVVDVPADQLRLLKGTEAREVWQGILKVSVAPDQPAMLGEYRILPDGVQFTPMFPLDPGRVSRQLHCARRIADHGRRGIAGEGHHADHGRDAGVSERGRRARESASFVQSLLRAHGHEGRTRLHPPAR